MKKFTTKLLMSIIAVAFAFVALGTSTYAWFSMNSTVTVTGMNIKAKSDTEFLVVMEGSTFDKTVKTIEATSTAEEKELLPVTPATTLTAANVGTATSWKYTFSDDPDEYEQGTNASWATCTESNIGQYVASETFAIGLHESSGVENTGEKALLLTNVTIAANTGITVVVVCGDNIYTHAATASNLTETIASNASQTGNIVTLYYFIDGENSNVWSNYIENLHGNVVLSFGIAE